MKHCPFDPRVAPVDFQLLKSVETCAVNLLERQLQQKEKEKEKDGKTQDADVQEVSL
jgi:hypothetical protein